MFFLVNVAVKKMLRTYRVCRQALTFEQALTQKNLLIVDVRSPEEVAAGSNCPGAIHVPVASVPSSLDLFGTDKSRPVVFYCRRGIRAGDAAAFLARQGFTNAFAATDGTTVKRMLEKENSS